MACHEIDPPFLARLAGRFWSIRRQHSRNRIGEGLPVIHEGGFSRSLKTAQSVHWRLCINRERYRTRRSNERPLQFCSFIATPANRENIAQLLVEREATRSR